jgi:hypothetical protein
MSGMLYVSGARYAYGGLRVYRTFMCLSFGCILKNCTYRSNFVCALRTLYLLKGPGFVSVIDVRVLRGLVSLVSVMSLDIGLS